MDQMALNWQVYGWTLAGSFLFGVVFCLVVRWSSKRQMVGQTAFAVIIGVTFTLLIMIPFFGLDTVTYMFPYFIASGIPMISEYLLRVQGEIQKDKEKAQDLAKDLLK